MSEHVSAMMGGMVVERIAQWGEASFHPPASPEVLRKCEVSCGHSLPKELRDLLAETNGVDGEYGLGLVWSAERIAEDNVRFRTHPRFTDLYMPFDGLAFFGDAGNGDQFGFSLRGNNDVLVWNHEDDSRTWVAPTVLTYLEEWMTGRLAV